MRAAEQAPQMKGQNLIDNFINNEGGKIQLKEEPEYVPQIAEEGNDAENEGEEAFFTESLAKIYIRQGRYSKALEIIKRLNLNYPKNAYFADQIRFLEKLIINNKIIIKKNDLHILSSSYRPGIIADDFIVLIQESKGGGLSSQFSSSNSIMGCP